ncbi:MAG: SDR family oxidoreductase [Deltaproteobacteria bacterium]|nr:SDR family oxidoreductase [Deltaproteobacteria bacterium]
MRRVIVVTGASRGLGRALCVELARRGHLVHGCGRDGTALDALQRELGGEHRFECVDVTDAAAVAAWAARVEAGGAPDLVVSNAALMNDPRPVWEVPVDEFARVVDVNVRGVFHVARAFLPGMNARRRGVLVNLSSGWGRSTDAGVAPYCASKFAVEGFSAAAAQDVTRGVAVVALNPGIIDTDMLRRCWPESAASYARPETWAPRAADLLLRLGPGDNGASLDVE